MSEQFDLVEVDFHGHYTETSDQGEWSHIVQALLGRILTDEVICKVHDEIERVAQSDRLDKVKFAKGISEVAWLQPHVFKRDDLGIP